MEIRELREEEIPVEAEVPSGAVAVGVVEDGQVVALIGAFTTVFLDPLWVAPEHRGKVLSRNVLRQLWMGMRDLLLNANVRMVVGHARQDQPVMAMLLKRIGGEEVFEKRPFVVRLEE